MTTRIAVIAALIVLCAACAGPAGELDELTLILDFVPGGIHAGIYVAAAEGHFADEGLAVDIQPPGSSTDTLRLVSAGQATVGIAPVADVAALRQNGEDVRVILALEQVPLGSLIALSGTGVRSPADLAGGTIGVTGVPSDVAVSEFMISADGADPASTDMVTIGFDAVANLIGGAVDAAFGFWSAEAVALELNGEAPVVMRPDEFGAPPYPELVFFTGGDTVVDRGDQLAGFTRALDRGYRQAITDPDAAIAALVAGAEGIDAVFSRAEFDAVTPHLLDDAGDFGTIDPDEFFDFLVWAQEIGVLTAVPPDLLVTDFMP